MLHILWCFILDTQYIVYILFHNLNQLLVEPFFRSAEAQSKQLFRKYHIANPDILKSFNRTMIQIL